MNLKFTFRPDPALVQEAHDMLMTAKRIVVVCHVAPDGDALGSSLGLWHVMRNLRQDVDIRVVTPDCPPRQLCFIPGINRIVPYSQQKPIADAALAEADLIVCLDFNDPIRLADMLSAFEQSKAKRLMVDHHLEVRIKCNVTFSYPLISSTSAILYMLLCYMGMEKGIDVKAGECFCTGMITDTGNFSYNSCDPDLYLILAQLVKLGVDKDTLYNMAINIASESRIRICGYGQMHMNLMPQHKASIIVLSREELDQFGYVKGDTEALVNVPLKMKDITYSIFIRQDDNENVKISMRSKGDFPVNKMCEDHFGGGGHVNAAGGEFKGSLSDALTRVLEIMPEYDKYLLR